MKVRLGAGTLKRRNSAAKSVGDWPICSRKRRWRRCHGQSPTLLATDCALTATQSQMMLPLAPPVPTPASSSQREPRPGSSAGCAYSSGCCQLWTRLLSQSADLASLAQKVCSMKNRESTLCDCIRRILRVCACILV